MPDSLRLIQPTGIDFFRAHKGYTFITLVLFNKNDILSLKYKNHYRLHVEEWIKRGGSTTANEYIKADLNR